MYVRFDDTRPGQARHLVFGEPVGVIAARDGAEVPDVIAAAAAHARSGRWVAGFVAYEAASGLDPSLATLPAPDGLPLVWFGVFDEPDREPGPPPDTTFSFGPWRPDRSEAAHAAGVEAVRTRIAAGDTYQANLTLRLHAPFTGDPLAAYLRLVDNQRGAFGAYLDIGSHVVLSASPELFFGWDGDTVTVRPMKGTAPRGRWPAEDEARRTGLLASEKDRAENLMIVDLLRNDLGRIAGFGSVRVTSLVAAERYDTVWQLTSTVTARSRPDTTLSGLFRALFPSGSVTGAPKVRTMEIIRDLEATPRGVYCGAIGYVAPSPAGAGATGALRAEFSVAIRTVVVDRATGRAEYGTGGGITWDSTPGGEYAEAMLKAAVLTAHRPRFDLLETMRWEPGHGVLRAARHVARLERSAAYFGYPFDREEVTGALESVAGDGPLRVRVTLDAAGALTVVTAPAPAPEEPVRLAVDDVPVDPSDRFLFHKTTHRSVYEEAAARHPGAGDVVLVNGAGHATETTIGNLAVLLDGGWCTPPLTDGCLPGVLREELLETGTLVERSVAAARLGDAAGIAVISSLRGWRPAVLAGRLSGSRGT
jgi:para-aminobenzoate synthetase / 4-amino-4-deoxychorismate lyase